MIKIVSLFFRLPVVSHIKKAVVSIIVSEILEHVLERFKVSEVEREAKEKELHEKMLRGEI